MNDWVIEWMNDWIISRMNNWMDEWMVEIEWIIIIAWYGLTNITYDMYSNHCMVWYECLTVVSLNPGSGQRKKKKHKLPVTKTNSVEKKPNEGTNEF